MNATQMGPTVTLNSYVPLQRHSDDDHRVWQSAPSASLWKKVKRDTPLMRKLRFLHDKARRKQCRWNLYARRTPQN